MVPAPPEATISAEQACAMARMTGRSYPVLAPSPALLVGRMTWTPKESMSLANSTASVPVAVRPPSIYTSYPEGSEGLTSTSMATVRASAPNSRSISFTSSGFRNAAELMETRFAPAFRTSSAVFRLLMPPPTVKGTVVTAATFFTTSRRVPRFSTVAVISRSASSSAPAAQ